MSKEIICSDWGRYESECTCLISPPPVVGDLREKIALTILADRNNWDAFNRGEEVEIKSANHIADSILALLKEAGYVKMDDKDEIAEALASEYGFAPIAAVEKIFNLIKRATLR